jgi:predicted nucleic acid-binding protein
MRLRSQLTSPRFFPDPLPVTRADVQKACEFLGLHPGLAVRDAIHVATMLQSGIRQIIGGDPDFDQIDEIRCIDPG